MRGTRVAVVILAAGLAATAAGCGGGGKKPATTPSATTTISKSATTTGGAEPSNGTPSFASTKNCRDLAGIAAKAAAALGASGNAGASLGNEAKVLQGLANAAPSEIHGDFETIAAAFAGFVQTLQNSGYKAGTPPTPKQAKALAKAAKTFDTAKLQQAEQHLEAWGKQNCKGVNVGG